MQKYAIFYISVFYDIIYIPYNVKFIEMINLHYKIVECNTNTTLFSDKMEEFDELECVQCSAVLCCPINIDSERLNRKYSVILLANSNVLLCDHLYSSIYFYIYILCDFIIILTRRNNMFLLFELFSNDKDTV